MRVKNKVFILSITILTCVAACGVIFNPVSAFAGASVSLTPGAPDSTWAIGTICASSVTAIGNTWTATNNNSGGTETLTIGVTSDGGWSPGSASAANQFVLKLGGTPTYSSGSGAAVNTVITSGTTLVTSLLNNGTAVFGLSFTAPSSGNEGLHTLTVTLTATSWAFVCGNNLTVTHTAGDTAPVTKTVTYGTVSSTLGGTGAKCWITRNLGATNQASSVSDSTEASAGWYWQFNRKAGWKYDGSLYRATTPTEWNAGYEGTNWESAKDPCASLLTGWRLPTYSEWSAADGGWSTWDDPWGSALKLHAAGYLGSSYGALSGRGSYGCYWSSAQYDAPYGWSLRFDSGISITYNSNKAYGFSVRCLKD